MKKVKRCILPALSAIFLLLCSCGGDVPLITESAINSDTEPEKTVTAVTVKEYKELISEFKSVNEEYFKDTQKAVTSLIGQKYVYAVTAYNHSDELTEIAEMFFDETSENTLNIYFALRGFENKEYEASEKEAQFKCSRKDDRYVYKAVFDAEAKSFDITLTVNDELKDSLHCDINDTELIKICYSGALGRTFISRVNKDKTSKIEWYDEYLKEIPSDETKEHGYVVYDGVTLSGIIK